MTNPTNAQKQSAYEAQRREWYRAVHGHYHQPSKSKGRAAT